MISNSLLGTLHGALCARTLHVLIVLLVVYNRRNSLPRALIQRCYKCALVADGIDGHEVMKRAFADGVVCRPGERFFGDPEPAKSFFRLAFTTVPREEIEPGIAALGRAIAASAR